MPWEIIRTVAKDVVGLHRRDSKYKKNTSLQRIWLAYSSTR